MTIKEKLTDIYDDFIWTLRHWRNSVRHFVKGIGRWFSYFKLLTTTYDFDYGSILSVERLQLTRVRDCIAKFQEHEGWEEDVKHMNLALRLLDIIEEDGCSEKVGSDVSFEPTGNGLYRLVDDPKSYWTIPVYVNTSNSKRFWKEFNTERYEDPRTGNLWKDHLRVAKAWSLYHKVREHYMRSWWD